MFNKIEYMQFSLLLFDLKNSLYYVCIVQIYVYANIKLFKFLH